MTESVWTFEQNAKRMTPAEVASSFVPHPSFRELTNLDHCYVVGPRGSGKTTLLKMLQGEALMAWQGRHASNARSRVNFSSVFLPADTLWSTQTRSAPPEIGKAAFVLQALYALVETMKYRSSGEDANGNAIFDPAELGHDREVSLVKTLRQGWRISPRGNSLAALSAHLDLLLLEVSRREKSVVRQFSNVDALDLISYGVRTFNREVGQDRHRWALLLDEMELAPPEIYNEIVPFVRGGNSTLILKISTSPFDRYYEFAGPQYGPMAGNDFRAVHLAGLPRTAVHTFSVGMWNSAVKSAGLPPTRIQDALGQSSIQKRAGSTGSTLDIQGSVIGKAAASDPDLAKWLKRRKVDLTQLESMTYVQRSATLRKVYPLVVFREALLTFPDGDEPARARSRKKQYEPFTGADAVITALEGNPRWIKTAYSAMFDSAKIGAAAFSVQPTAQWDALAHLADRFESLMRVMPSQRSESTGLGFNALIDKIALYFHAVNVGKFRSDPPTTFVVDGGVPQDVYPLLTLGLYSGALVHVRDKGGEDTITDYRGKRFRLAYLLAIRDNLESPMRLGKHVALSRVLASQVRPVAPEEPDDPIGQSVLF
ncbi:hypothetical protein [Nocardioides sp.]|uniref:ORC-CDC6 family AAA ATPase n=1 Tax=Nocardioides sp. TaxID=35761 RepID=UPI00260FD6FE|nr:hypothetical protein [Nocardioides sp.]MDI6909821.1 hypothetical protein [Nocardioides sp.]